MADNCCKSSVFKVLIIKPSSLGDILHALPVVEIIKEKYPDAVIDWMVAPQFSPLLELHPGIRRKILFRRKQLGKFFSFFPAFLELVRELRSEKYDMVIDMQGLLRSSFFARLARTKVIWGFSDTREKMASFFYNRKVKTPEDKHHAVEKNLYLVCEAMGVPFKMPAWVPPRNEAACMRLKDTFSKEGIQQGKTFVGIVPGARWKTKEWPPDFFASVVSLIAGELPYVEFIMIGSSDDSTAASEISRLAAPGAVIHDLTGKTGISELVELVRTCLVVLANDSGPMHIAAILKVFVFALFGPTDPEKTGPFGDSNEVFAADKGCIKCMRRYCVDGSYGCHSAIDPGMAAARISQILKKSGAK
ncbi:MAG: lipopolysaccharide heptosyltransferase II [Lentisphaerae bacterium GWF2_45_14]|nr:MAG: lipopolysaccharide heptosyltransferase II [Lentisphaerae bacterium GWF2_45_14]